MKFTVLVGPKHSGKTSVGRALASLLSADFIDLDEFIALRNGKSPRTLYIEGPEIFRRAEAEALAALLVRSREKPVSPMVIASGGGLADNPEALVLLNKSTAIATVFLDISAQTAWERISRAGELPPFLQTEDPQATHHSLHERRGAAYRQFASLAIRADNKRPEEIAREILQKWELSRNLVTS